jgi:hypothetical protein
MKSLSSIFSFDTAKAVELPGHWRASIVLLIVLLIGAELFARVVMAPLGEHLWAYSPTASSHTFEWYRHLATSGRTPDVIAIGDSTGARNFDPAAFAAHSEFDDVYSLARAGNFPLALRSNTLPLLEVGDPPDLVVLLQSAGSFRDDSRVSRIERGAMSPILSARRDGKPLVVDYLHVTRLYPARSLLRLHWVKGQALPIPSATGSFSPFRRTDGQTPEALPTAFPISQGVKFSAERRRVIVELIEIARARDFPVIAVIGPQRQANGDVVTDLHLAWLRELAASECDRFTVLDLRDAPFIDMAEFKDNNHLYADGAARFSAHLAAVIQRELMPLPAARSQSRCSRVAAQPSQMLRRGE